MKNKQHTVNKVSSLRDLSVIAGILRMRLRTKYTDEDCRLSITYPSQSRRDDTLLTVYFSLRTWESCKSESDCFPTCGIPANHNPTVFRLFSDLRESRKSESDCFPTCGNPASRNPTVFRFAGIPQVGIQLFSDLRESRKSESNCFPTCGNPASQNPTVFRLAGIPQVRIQLFSGLRESRKSESNCFPTCGIPASHY
jgi:hypothetical protein